MGRPARISPDYCQAIDVSVYQQDRDCLTACFNSVNADLLMLASRVPPSHRILLVDDNRDGLAVRKALLEEDGHCVTPVDNPLIAIELFRSAPYDLVITDYRMPKMDGIELIAQIRKIDSKVPVLLISGFVGILDLQPTKTGADAVLRKDAGEGVRLKRIVQMLLRRKAFLVRAKGASGPGSHD